MNRSSPSDIVERCVQYSAHSKNINLRVPLRYDAALADYTTFRVGGPADVLALPRTEAELYDVVAVAATADIPLTILGGGANVVVSDAGIRGIVLVTTELSRITIEGTIITAGSGAAISAVAATAADNELAGLDWIYAMPGSAGGAVWMNARCYGGEIADVLSSVSYIDKSGARGIYKPVAADFDYKISPFQDGRRIITSISFFLSAEKGMREELWERMRGIEADRRSKGHFDAPCAGSIFKNDRRIGEPSGAIIDRLGLRGLGRGGARISPNHGNIIINTGAATAGDIRALVTEVQDRVYRRLGHNLEPEVLFIGEWE